MVVDEPPSRLLFTPAVYLSPLLLHTGLPDGLPCQYGGGSGFDEAGGLVRPLGPHDYRDHAMVRTTPLGYLCLKGPLGRVPGGEKGSRGKVILVVTI